MRVLPIENIPPEIWNNDVLGLPSQLSVHYNNELERLNLLERSVASVDGAVHGGRNQDETFDHFALRFGVSAGRVVYCTLGPTESFSGLSDALLSTFSDGHVALLDVPCGTGAMTAALVMTLVHLREKKVIPRLPLTISVCAGDYSPSALEIFDSLMQRVSADAATEGIVLVWEVMEWDATRGDSTARMVDSWFASTAGATEHFVVVSNFSGALQSAGEFEAFSPCFEHILARLHDKQSTVMWVEPATKNAKTGLFGRLLAFLLRRIGWFTAEPTDAGQNMLEAQYQITHTVNGSVFRSNVAVLRFDRQ